MKNREKYKNELIESINKNGRLCDFVKNHGVFRVLGRVDECSCVYCSSCAVLLQLWLDEECEECEECEEPETDWYYVPIDTLVRVRNSKNENWTLQYFKGIGDTIPNHRYETWDDGRTSKTTDGLIMAWKYCELAEEV